MRITTTPGYVKKYLRRQEPIEEAISLRMEKWVIFMHKRLELSSNETVQFL